MSSGSAWGASGAQADSPASSTAPHTPAHKRRFSFMGGNPPLLPAALSGRRGRDQFTPSRRRRQPKFFDRAGGPGKKPPPEHGSGGGCMGSVTAPRPPRAPRRPWGPPE